MLSRSFVSIYPAYLMIGKTGHPTLATEVPMSTADLWGHLHLLCLGESGSAADPELSFDHKSEDFDAKVFPKGRHVADTWIRPSYRGGGRHRAKLLAHRPYYIIRLLVPHSSVP